MIRVHANISKHKNFSFFFLSLLTFSFFQDLMGTSTHSIPCPVVNALDSIYRGSGSTLTGSLLCVLWQSTFRCLSPTQSRENWWWTLKNLTKCCHGLASRSGNIRILSPLHANFNFKDWDAFNLMRLAQILTSSLSRSNPSSIFKLALYRLQISLAN